MSKPKTNLCTTATVVDLINRLNEALRDNYGPDFAYTVAAKGHIIAANNLTYGHVRPQVSDE